MPDDDDKDDKKEKQSVVDMYLLSAGEAGQFLWAVKESLAPILPGVDDVLGTLTGMPVQQKTAPTPPPPPKKPKAQKDLRYKLYVMPFNVGMAGESVKVYAQVNYKDVDANGQPVQWPYPESWIGIQYQQKDHAGSGPFEMDLPGIDTYSVNLRVVVDGGKTVTLTTEKVRSVCGAQLPKDAELKDLTCALYSEGGSQSGKKQLDDQELRAIAWTIRNRHDALAKAQQVNDQKHWKYFAGRWYKDPQGKAYPITATLTYRELLRGKQQFTGVDGSEYNQCASPMKSIPTMGACQRAQKCADIINEVFGKGQAADPYQGKGNPDYPGVFYYKVVGIRPPHDGPQLPALTSKDHHYYLGMDPDYRP